MEQRGRGRGPTLVAGDTIRRDLEQVSARATALCDGLTGDELVLRVEPRRWSIAENLTHLRITTETFLPAVDRAIGRTRERGALGRGPFRLGVYGRMLVRYVEPPPLLRLPAPRVLRPVAVGAPAEVLPRFLEAQMRMAQRLDAAAGLDLTALRFGSPLARYVRMNLAEFLSVFNGHARRHVWQAAGVRRRVLERKAVL